MSDEKIVSEDPYAYLDREDFTSEKYKIEVRGLPKFYGIREFKKLINEKLELGSNKIKPPKKGGKWVYVCFRNKESQENAISKLNGITWKQCVLRAQIAKPAPDPFVKRKMEEHEEPSLKKAKLENTNPVERVKNSTTPLWNVPYDEQLKTKQNHMKSVLEKLCQNIAKANKDTDIWFSKQRNLYNSSCELLPIVHADVVNGYRNKCEFTIGRDETGEKKMIGFRLSSYAAGSTAVGPIDELIHIPEEMKKAIKILEKFVQNSDLDVFDPVTHKGHWKQVTARFTTLKHLMLIIAITPQNMSEEDKKKLMSQIKEFFEQDENKEAGVTSLYFQTIDKKKTGGEGGGSIEYIDGAKFIEEKILDLKFRISPEAFFQVNTLGAELLYKKAIELAQPTKDTAILDICCGTGTIGLCFSKHCGEVFGIEVISSAILDAKENVKANEITNCEFFTGKAEDILTPVIQRTSKPDIIAVVDPPRAGLHQKALLTLRKTKSIKKLIYISCDPKAATKNLIDLARPHSKQYIGDPLIPVKAIPVDMFPHTNHCELIVYLERLPKSE